MNMFKPTSARTPDEYIAMIGDETRRKDVQQLHDLIKKLAPDLKPHIASGMIGYGTYHYKYASGREGDSSIIGLASQKNYIAVYASCVATDGQYVAEKYKKELPKANVGRSCIRFSTIDKIDLGVLSKVIKEGVAATKVGYAQM